MILVTLMIVESALLTWFSLHVLQGIREKTSFYVSFSRLLLLDVNGKYALMLLEVSVQVRLRSNKARVSVNE
jgi:hypothetical protein